MKRRNDTGGEFGAVVVLAGTLAFGGCVSEAPPQPVLTLIATATLRSHDPQYLEGVTHERIRIAVTPITYQNRTSAPQIHRLITYTQNSVNASGQMVQTQGQSDDYVVPLPTFRVTITNQTGHVIRFTQTIFRLQDSRGRRFQLFASLDELIAWNLQNDGQLAANAEFVQQERALISQVPLVNRNTELLNGDDYTGFLAFNVNPVGGELLDQIDRLTLRIAEVPVDMNEAGVASRTTEFEFVFDKTTYQQPASCPAGTTLPSWTTCVVSASSGGEQMSAPAPEPSGSGSGTGGDLRPVTPPPSAAVGATENSGGAAAATSPSGNLPEYPSRADVITAMHGVAGFVSSCANGQAGTAQVAITFASSGRVTTANVVGTPYAGTPAAACISRAVQGASVPAFSRPTFNVTFPFAVH